MLFQMQAMMNIELFKMYEVKKILTCCPHDYNTFKNEYTDFGLECEVIHHSQFLAGLIGNSKFKIQNSKQIQNSKNQTQKALTQNALTQNSELSTPNSALRTQHSELKITFHDPCYLGRANGEYDAPRKVLSALGLKLTEMKRSKSFALCCGAGGGQMFKEAEKGDKEVFIERIEDVIATGADIVATACPFCMVMLTDGIKYKNREESLKNYDIAELVSMALGL